MAAKNDGGVITWEPVTINPDAVFPNSGYELASAPYWACRIFAYAKLHVLLARNILTGSL